MQELQGTGTALVTPMHQDGTVDYDRLKKLINYNIKGGVEFLVSLGTTGEAVTLTQRECQEIFDFTLRHVGGRVPVVFGVFGSNDTGTILRRFKSYNIEEAAALLSASPYYNKPTQEGIFEHYKAISDSSPLPIILYNVPGRTASNMEAETTLKLAEECPNILGIKEASGDLVQMAKIIKDKPEPFMVWSGDDPTACAAASLGAHGVISVISNAFPYEFSAMIRKVKEGNMEMANKLNLLLLDVHPWLYAEGNPVGVKAALEVMDLCARHVRLPLLAMSKSGVDQLEYEIKRVLKKSSYSHYYADLLPDLLGDF